MHLSAIHSFGDGLPYAIVKPIIRHCSPEEVQRFELTSPVSVFCLSLSGVLTLKPSSTYGKELMVRAISS
jgi:hypothetical protein